MAPVVTFGTIALIIQLLCSFEELITGFRRKWFITNLSFPNFLLVEMVHIISWLIVLYLVQYPNDTQLLWLFLSLMLVNGVQRTVWSIDARKYVPGLYTAPFHIINFTYFYLVFGRLAS